MDELRISQIEMVKLLSESVQIGYQKAMEISGKAPKYISQHKAYQMFNSGRVKGWVSAGLIVAKPNGNGKKSTINYEYAKLMELDASNRIIIRKPYNK